MQRKILMNIKKITNISKPAFTGIKANNTYKTSPIKNDSFEHNNQKFNLDDAMKVLADVRIENGQKKFNQKSLIKLEEIIENEPKKWNSVYTLAKNPSIKSDFVYLMASKPLEQLNHLAEISEVKDKKGNYKYSGKEMMQFNDKLLPEELEKVLVLTKTSMPVKNIVLLAQTPNFPDLEKISSKVLEMENLVGEKLEDITFTKNKYEKENYVITAKANDNTEKRELLNKDLKRYSFEEVSKYKNNSGKSYIIKKSTDLRNNTVSKVRLREDKQIGRPVFENEVRIIKDKNNKVKYYEYTSPSDVNGVFDIRQKTVDGKEKILSSGKIDKKTGIISVKKDMTSPDGTRTQYLYENDPQGNRIVDYKITDKNGNILLNKSQTFEIINDKKFITSKDKEDYEITIDEDSISVQSLNDKDKKAKFTSKDNFIGNKKGLLNTLKQITGEELIKLGKTVDFLESIEDPLDSFYNGGCRSISTGSDVFLFMHELGHAIDFNKVESTSNDSYAKTILKSITMDKEVNKVFEEEKSAFFKAYPDTQRDHVEYFMNILNHYNGETGGLSEAIAESHALLSCGKSYEPLAIRSQYLQQNFPKTIALLESKFSDNSFL